ncbi:MAG: hypothetical protein SNJ56_07030, partial [Termitinemataceae bacterium]
MQFGRSMGTGGVTLLVAILLLLVAPVSAFAQMVLRGQVRVDLEPVYIHYVDVPYPLDTNTAHRHALEEVALYFGAMIYGWTFDYDIGERARKIPEVFELQSLGSIPFGDPKLVVTDAKLENSYLFVWVDYRPDETQQRRLAQWRSGTLIKTRGQGEGPLAGPIAVPRSESPLANTLQQSSWMDGKRAALEDAARAAVRATLRGTERNRPKQSRGRIALAEFPRYWVDSGRWQCSAAF